MKKISCLGPDGSFSAHAAKIFGADEIVFLPGFSETLRKLTDGETDAAVLPIENTTRGGIRQCLDLLEANRSVYAVAETVLPVDYRLATPRGLERARIARVYSHEIAVESCARYLREQLPQARVIYVDPTKGSLSALDGESAAIVGAHLAKEGVVLSEENIADDTRNFTHYLLVERGKEGLPKRGKKIFLSAALMHRPGSLLGVLQIIDEFGLNISKIESRPMRDLPGQYRFFIEFEGCLEERRVQYALAKLEESCRQFRLIGAY